MHASEYAAHIVRICYEKMLDILFDMYKRIKISLVCLYCETMSENDKKLLQLVTQDGDINIVSLDF